MFWTKDTPANCDDLPLQPFRIRKAILVSQREAQTFHGQQGLRVFRPENTRVYVNRFALQLLRLRVMSPYGECIGKVSHSHECVRVFRTLNSATESDFLAI